LFFQNLNKNINSNKFENWRKKIWHWTIFKSEHILKSEHF
jgi:hypothetical protein